MHKHLLNMITLLFLLLITVVGAAVFVFVESETGPTSTQVLQDTRAHWNALSLSHLNLEQIIIDERDVMAPDRVRFELSLSYYQDDKSTINTEKRSVIYRLFNDTWRESRY